MLHKIFVKIIIVRLKKKDFHEQIWESEDLRMKPVFLGWTTEYRKQFRNDCKTQRVTGWWERITSSFLRMLRWRWVLDTLTCGSSESAVKNTNEFRD